MHRNKFFKKRRVQDGRFVGWMIEREATERRTQTGHVYRSSHFGGIWLSGMLLYTDCETGAWWDCVCCWLWCWSLPAPLPPPLALPEALPSSFLNPWNEKASIPSSPGLLSTGAGAGASAVKPLVGFVPPSRDCLPTTSTSPPSRKSCQSSTPHQPIWRGGRRGFHHTRGASALGASHLISSHRIATACEIKSMG